MRVLPDKPCKVQLVSFGMRTRAKHARRQRAVDAHSFARLSTTPLISLDVPSYRLHNYINIRTQHKYKHKHKHEQQYQMCHSKQQQQ